MNVEPTGHAYTMLLLGRRSYRLREPHRSLTTRPLSGSPCRQARRHRVPPRLTLQRLGFKKSNQNNPKVFIPDKTAAEFWKEYDAGKK